MNKGNKLPRRTYVLTRHDNREHYFFEYPCESSQATHLETLRKDRPKLLFEPRLYTDSGYMLTE